ncbi:MAG: c-type cytochrome [Pseudomonadota bacterium]
MRFHLAAAVAIFAIASPAFGDEAAVERGAKIYLKCKSCHRIGPGAANGAGPHLNEVFGRRAGSLDGFRYSKDMTRAGAEGLFWDHQTLDLYLENPKSLISRTRMNFRGIKDAADRGDLVAYLRAFSDDPQYIPESAPTEPALDQAVLSIEGDRDYGEYLSSECVTCHRIDGADEGIPSITGWPAEDFVVALHAYRAKHRENQAMQMVASRLSDDEIAGLAAYFA